MSRLLHENLLRPNDLVENDLGIGLVYPATSGFSASISGWLASPTASRSPTSSTSSVRSRRAALCALEPGGAPLPVPHAVWVRQRDAGQDLRAIVGDWRTAGSIPVTGLTGSSSGGVTGLFGTTDGQTPTPGATVVVRAIPGDADLRLTEAFQAPEQIHRQDRPDQARCLALGALSYYILTGHPPAANRAALHKQLHREDGLDLAADLPQATEKLRQLILDATRRR